MTTLYRNPAADSWPPKHLNEACDHCGHPIRFEAYTLSGVWGGGGRAAETLAKFCSKKCCLANNGSAARATTPTPK